MYMTGESTFVGGFVGAMASGFMTAAKVLGFATFAWTIMNITPVEHVSVEDDETAMSAESAAVAASAAAAAKKVGSKTAAAGESKKDA